ncbi:nucleotide exchange factor GrpE, partial [Lysobacter sp. 2RAB21]
MNLDAQDPAPVAELSEVETLRAELNKLREDSLRERAELDNQRKRVARDVEMARKFANERLLGALLPVIDSLEAGLTVAGA